MKNKHIIAFGGRKRAGKGVLSDVICNKYNDSKIITIAKYLKLLCCELLEIDYDTLNKYKDDGTLFEKHVDKRWINTIHDKTNIDLNIIKDTIGEIVFTNVRDMLQIIGTDLIRKYQENYHVNNMIQEIHDSKENYIVIDDLRFPNEKEAIEKLGGKCYYIIRPKFMKVSNHASELALRWQNFNMENVIINDDTLDNFKINFENFIIGKYNKFLLSENKNYLVNCNIGNTFNEAKNIIESIENNENFINDGKIKLDNKWIYNPCINENIKKFLN